MIKTKHAEHSRYTILYCSIRITRTFKTYPSKGKNTKIIVTIIKYILLFSFKVIY